MFSPLLTAILARHGYPVVTEETLEAEAASRPISVLFFPGDWKRHGESNDVAVVLPELDRAFQGELRPMVVSRDAERALQCRYRFTAYPTLVMLRTGAYLGAISRVQAWTDYLTGLAALMEGEPCEPPPFAFPEGCVPTASPAVS